MFINYEFKLIAFKFRVTSYKLKFTNWVSNFWVTESRCMSSATSKKILNQERFISLMKTINFELSKHYAKSNFLYSILVMSSVWEIMVSLIAFSYYSILIISYLLKGRNLQNYVCKTVDSIYYLRNNSEQANF